MKTRTCRIGLVVIATLAVIAPVPAWAQSSSTHTSISVTNILSGSPIVGGTFTTDLQVSITNSATPEVGVMGAEIWLTFNPSIVTVSDADSNPANGTQVEVANGFFDGDLVVGANEVLIGSMPSTAPPECTSVGACVHVAVSHTGGSGPVTNKTGTVATITWAAMAAGSLNMGIVMVPPGIPPGSVLSDPDGQPIPINGISMPTINVIDAGTIEGVVQRQGGQGGHASTALVAIEAGNVVVAKATTDANGSFSLAVPVGGTYTVNVSYPGYLQAQKSSISVAGSNVDIGPMSLVGGDVNADNCVNILDIVSIIGKFGQTGLPASAPEDINDDARINILDLTIAAGNFTRCGPRTWTP